MRPTNSSSPRKTEWSLATPPRRAPSHCGRSRLTTSPFRPLPATRPFLTCSLRSLPIRRSSFGILPLLLLRAVSLRAKRLSYATLAHFPHLPQLRGGVRLTEKTSSLFSHPPPVFIPRASSSVVLSTRTPPSSSLSAARQDLKSSRPTKSRQSGSASLLLRHQPRLPANAKNKRSVQTQISSAR